MRDLVQSVFTLEPLMFRGWVVLCGEGGEGLSCVLWGVEQHLWSPPMRCQEHPPALVLTAKNVSMPYRTYSEGHGRPQLRTAAVDAWIDKKIDR